MLAGRLVYGAPALLLLAAAALVLAQGQVPQLALQLAVALEPRRPERATGGGGGDRAAGLLGVAAVREAAAGGESLHVREGAVEGVRRRPELQLAQPRRVDEQRGAGQAQQLAGGGGVPPA